MKMLTAMMPLLLMAACSLPETRVSSGAQRPSISIAGAPEQSTLYLDGLPVGLAQTFDGKPNVLALEEGSHVIEVRVKDSDVFKQKIFVSNGENRLIQVVAGAVQ